MIEFWTNGAGLPQALVRRARRAEAAGFGGSHAMSLVPSGVAERFADVNGVQLRLITGGLR